MLRTIMLGFLVSLLTSSLAASGFNSSSAGGSNRSRAGGETVFNSEAQLCPTMKKHGIATPDAPLTASSSGTWQWAFGPESCSDWCVGGCSWQCPAYQCPANPAGQPCSPFGSECYVPTGGYFHYYHCW